MDTPEKITRQFPMIKQLLPLFKPIQVKVIKKDMFNEEHIILHDQEGNGYAVKNNILFIIKPMVSEQ
jgi:hypothetical protein